MNFHFAAITTSSLPKGLSLQEDIVIKTSFNHCSSGSGQNSVIPVVCDVPE